MSNLSQFDEVIREAVTEAREIAFSGNLDREHHLESAVEEFANIGKLLEAKKIVHELLDHPEEED